MGDLSAVLNRLESHRSGWVSVLQGTTDRAVTEVRLIEDLEQIERAGAGALLVLGRTLFPYLDDYRFDIALRRAAHRKVGAVMVVSDPGAKVPMTAGLIAQRASITLLGLTPEADLTDAVQAMVQEVLETLALTVDRARRVCEAIRSPSTRARTLEDLLNQVSVLIGRQVRLGPAPGTDASNVELVGAPATITDQSGPWLVTERFNEPAADALLEMVLWRLAGEVGRSTWEQKRLNVAQRRSAGELLLQLVSADRDGRSHMATTARRLGIRVDDWHTLSHFELDNLLELVDSDDVAAYQLRDELADLIRDATDRFSGVWSVGHDHEKLLLLGTSDDAPSRSTIAEHSRQMERIVEVMTRRVARLRVFCGVGTAHTSIGGIATSSTEARLAVASARLRNIVNTVVQYDSIGMQTTLLEWYASPTVQQAIERLFDPLSSMPQIRREATLRTIAIYLDLQCNTAKTAEKLHLHRNAVRYRIQRAFEQLDIDESDADQRLFLHLACRSQLMVSDGVKGWHSSS